MIANIRGGLGTSLLELMACYALAFDNGTDIERIDINCGGWSDDGAGNVLKDYISELFVRPKAPVRVTQGTAKLGVCKDAKLLELVLKYNRQIRAALGPFKFYFPAPTLPVMHVRRGDYQWVPLETYIDYAKKTALRQPLYLIGNIAEDTAEVARIPGTLDISNTASIDWLAAYFAPEVIGTASTFLVSILFMQPDKKVKMFRNQTGAVFDEIMGPLMRKFEPQFPGFQWI